MYKNMFYAYFLFEFYKAQNVWYMELAFIFVVCFRRTQNAPRAHYKQLHHFHPLESVNNPTTMVIMQSFHSNKKNDLKPQPSPVLLNAF